MEGQATLSQYYAPPKGVEKVDNSFSKPAPKPLPSTAVGPQMEGLRTDAELAAFISSSKPGTAVVEYGTSWCQKCHEMFPTFYALSKKYNQHKYAVAQVETMESIVGSIKYTPTFAIYKNGRKVDEVIGKEPERLADHLWLQSD